MRMVQFHKYTDGSPLFINVDNIVSVHVEGATTSVSVGTTFFRVRESVDTVMESLGPAALMRRPKSDGRPPLPGEHLDAVRLKRLRNLCGYVENGTSQVVRVFQDDATREWIVKWGEQNGRSCCGRSLAAAIDNIPDSALED